MPQEITGRLIVLNETQSFASGFQKREFVIEEIDVQYPQKLKFEAMKDGCDRLDAFNVGDTIKVHYNLRGNEYNGKYYVQLQAWKMEGVKRGNPPPPRQSTPPPTSYTNDELDDIPF